MARFSSYLSALMLAICGLTRECTSLLNCSEFTSTKTTSSSMASLLSSCFAANPYDTTQLPIASDSYLSMYYDYSVVYFVSFDQGAISLLGQLTLWWQDAYRQWNVSQVPLQQIQVPLSAIWYPQILFLSTIKKKSLKLLAPDDVAILVPTATIVIVRNVVDGHCDDDYTSFPFDTQVCSIDFAINRYFFVLTDIVLSRLSYTYRLESFTNEDWTLVNVAHAPMNSSFTETVIYPNGSASTTVAQVINNAQTGFLVNITLQRHATYYIMNVLLPLFVLTAVGQTAFAIPEDADSKILVPLTVLLGFMFVQGIVASYIPHSATSPIVANYVIACIMLSGLSCLACALCKWLALLTIPLPAAVKLLWLDGVGFLLFPSHWFRASRRSSSTTRRSSLIDMNHLSIITGIDFANVKSNVGNAMEQRAPGQVVKDQEVSKLKEDDSEKEHPWLPVAEVLNRLAALGHVTAIFALFFTLVFPLWIKWIST